MKRRWLTVVITVVALAGLTLSAGCAGNWGDSTARDRQAVVQQDVRAAKEGVIWLVGLDEESGLHEDSFPPY